MMYIGKRYSNCLLLVAIGIMAILTSCQGNKTERSNDLVIVTQTDTIYGMNDDNRCEFASFTIDVPVNGPQALVDSVMMFLNNELYEACESNAHFDEDTVSFSKETLYTDDGKRLLSQYMEKYKSEIQDRLWRSFGLILKMEAQTEKYITYGLEFFYCGAGCSSEKYYYTFDKRDGHQVKEIISHENIVRFFKDYPEYAKQDDFAWEFRPEQDYFESFYGLLNDHFSLVIIGWYNHFFTIDIPYSQIFSYLSQEAQSLVEQTGEEETMLPAYLPERSYGGEVWMKVDTVNHALLGYIRAAGGPRVSTLMHYEPDLEVYPKRVYSIDADDCSTVFLFIYSRGHLLYYDEAMTCIYNDAHHLQPIPLFSVDGQRDSIVCCLWYDQLVEASNGFPYEEVDKYRFGIHYDRITKRLYVPIMDSHDSCSVFTNTSCLQYTGRYKLLQFNGKEFVPAGTDGAWWLNADMRNYKRTVSNRKTADGIEQIDLMHDGTYRRAFWKGAKTLDDLRKYPDEVKVGKEMDFIK